MKKFIRTLVSWGMAVIVCLSLFGCEKFPEGQGELIVKVNSTGRYRVVVKPSDGGPSIARSDVLTEGWNTVSFTLNAGNYIVSSGNSPIEYGVQVVEGESVTLYLD